MNFSWQIYAQSNVLSRVGGLGGSYTLPGFVMNNAQLGLVRQQQQLFYGRRYSAAHFERRTDLAAVARAFGVRGESADAADLDLPRLQELLRSPGPLVVDVRVPGSENVLPMVPPGGSNLDMILPSM